MAVFLVPWKKFSVHGFISINWTSHFLRGTRKTRPCLPSLSFRSPVLSSRSPDLSSRSLVSLSGHQYLFLVTSLSFRSPVLIRLVTGHQSLFPVISLSFRSSVSHSDHQSLIPVIFGHHSFFLVASNQYLFLVTSLAKSLYLKTFPKKLNTICNVLF